ncbi:unnamed protein product [Paramecium sonneborni]|uniref:Uncharacterized protein n=1 Tax=Paramecium sonneborni TaxID=65129 RepID=A0A8S1RDF4_9CILI|nr:unnamed protein product [Paramecium sonneborni]
MYISFRIDDRINLYIVEQEFINPFCNLEKTTTIDQIENTLEMLKQNNICAIINCIDNDQSMKAYGIHYLNIHINLQDQLESSRLFLHFWTKIKKCSVAIYCDSSMQKSIKVLKNYLKHLFNWDEERVQKEIQEQNMLNENKCNLQKEIAQNSKRQQQERKSGIKIEEIENKNLKNQINWNKIYGSEEIESDQPIQQAIKIQSRFIQNQILKNQ